MPENKTANILSIIIAFLALVAAAGGIFIEDLYRDNSFVVSVWRGNDLVTLFIGVPVLVAALLLSLRGSRRALLVWLGMLDYMLYNYGYYLFGTTFNPFFVLYVALFTLSIFALIFALVKVDVGEIKRSFRDRTPVRLVSGYMLFVALGLSSVYIIHYLNFVVSGETPEIILRTGHVTHVIAALDMSLLVPFLVLGAIWLWVRRPWGYLLGAIVNVKGTVYTLALTSATLSAVRAGFSEAQAELPLWLFLSFTSLIAAVLLLWNIGAAGKAGETSG